MTCREARPFLNAYLDGELDLARAVGIEDHVQECAACSGILDSQKRLSEAVAGAPYYRATPALQGRLESPAAPMWQRPAPWLLLTASVAVAFVLIALRGPSEKIGNEVIQAHLRAISAGHLVDVSAPGGRTVRPWFAGKLDYALEVEDISARGFRLEGGRLDALEGRTVAALVYRRGPHIVNVFVWPAAEESDKNPVSRSAHGLNIVNWRAEGMNWWAVSDLDLPELQQLPLCPCFMPVHETLRG